MILQTLADATYERVAEAERRVSLREIRAAAEKLPRGDFPFETALKKPGLSLICEVKRASPSKGLIAPQYPYANIAREYEHGGADAISVLTEPTKFLGADEHLREISNTVKIPLLRKDFTVSEYQIYEAKVLGASAILLICAILNDWKLITFPQIAARLGLSVLTETHTADEIKRAIDCGATIIGVNNRDLNTFDTNLSATEQLSRFIPKEAVFVSESGIRTPSDAIAARKLGADAVLIGEALMRSDNRAKFIEECKREN